MLNKELHEGINDQINKEMASAYLYLSMAAYLEGNNLSGSAHWMRKQAEEEMEHAMKMFDYMFDRGNQVTLLAIDTPPAEFSSPLDVFEQVLAHERKVTGLIHSLYALSIEHKDYAAQTFLQWFVNEQVEEERNADGIVQKLRMVGDKGHALLMIDRELGAR